MKKLSEVKVVVFGILVIVVSGLLLAALCAGGVLWGVIPENALEAVGAVVTLTAALLGGAFVGRKANGAALPKALAASGGYLLLVFILRGLLFKTVGDRVWLPVITAVVGSILGTLLTAGRRKNGRKR